MSLRKELGIVLGVMLVGWLVLVVGLGRWQRSRPRDAVAEPDLVHYPGTESAEEQTSANLGFRRYWFHLNEEYPSQSVFYWYQNELQPDGWRLMGRGLPQWMRKRDRNRVADVFRATWVDRRGLFQIDLEMASPITVTEPEMGQPTEERQPGLEIIVTLRRTLLPGLVLPQEEAQPKRDEIEVK